MNDVDVGVGGNARAIGAYMIGDACKSFIGKYHMRMEFYKAVLL